VPAYYSAQYICNTYILYTVIFDLTQRGWHTSRVPAYVLHNTHFRISSCPGKGFTMLHDSFFFSFFAWKTFPPYLRNKFTNTLQIFTVVPCIL